MPVEKSAETRHLLLFSKRARYNVAQSTSCSLSGKTAVRNVAASIRDEVRATRQPTDLHLVADLTDHLALRSVF